MWFDDVWSFRGNWFNSWLTTFREDWDWNQLTKQKSFHIDQITIESIVIIIISYPKSIDLIEGEIKLGRIQTWWLKPQANCYVISPTITCSVNKQRLIVFLTNQSQGNLFSLRYLNFVTYASRLGPDQLVPRKRHALFSSERIALSIYWLHDQQNRTITASEQRRPMIGWGKHTHKKITERQWTPKNSLKVNTSPCSVRPPW